MDRADWHIPDWLSGAEELSMEAEFAYFRLCLFIYQFDGLLKDDDQANARRCKMSTRAFRQVKAELLTACKIEVRDGYLWNARCEKVLAGVCSLSEAQSRRAQRRWEKVRENGGKSPEKAGVSAGKTEEKGAEIPEKDNEINGSAHAVAHAGQDATSESRKIDNPDGLSPPYTPQAENLFSILEEQAEPPAPAVDLDAMFEQWWELFPRYRRGSKGPARKKWLAIVRRKAATHDALLDGVRRYLAAGYGESHYACGAERWLNDERWTIESFPIPGDVESAAHQAHGDTHGTFRHDRSTRPASRNGFCAIVAERAGAGADRGPDHPGDGERGRGVPDQAGALDLDRSEWSHG